MKRLLFHYPVFNTGGAEMSSLRMMKALADRGWDITLVLTTGGGALESSVDSRVRVVPLRPRAFGDRFLVRFGLIRDPGAWLDLLGYVLMRAIGTARMLPFLFRRYDAAAMLLVCKSTLFLRYFVRANIKVQWIRNDLSGADPTGKLTAVLTRAAPWIDHFVCVSEVTKHGLISAVPAAVGKTEVIYNILDAATMRSRAQDRADPFPPRVGGALRILTVCRLIDRAKGLLRMVRVCVRLAEAGHDFCWYVAGDGPDRQLLEDAIRDAGVQNRMILLGLLPNPFPAYVHTDLVAMLSHYEGLSGVVNEARVLARPVIATRVSGIDEQLTDGVNGLVVDNDEQAIVAGMERLLVDHMLRNHLAHGGYPAALLDDDAKVVRVEQLFGC